MCGILAIVDGQANRAAAERALPTLRHRGPDGTGVWHSPERGVLLGHTRLAIIDPAMGAQPLSNEDGSLWAVVNGEFYDHEVIRASLRQRGHRFGTQSDSEILLHLYEEHGLDCFAWLRGEFAFALWDEPRQRLFVARDRFGIKPVCYHHRGSRLYVASEAKALFALGVPAAWNRAAMFQVCALQYPLPHQTLFDGIAQLPPGHYLVADAHGLKVQRYWNLDFAPHGAMADNDARARLRQELTNAVRLRLRADVPVCFHLSGGLDSTTIVALAQHLGAQPVCYTVAFDHDHYNEHAQAQATATMLGVELRTVSATSATMFAALEEAVYQSEGLAINGHLPAKYLLAAAMRADGYKVVLSGEGADEMFGGYAHLRQDLLEATGGDVASLHAANATMAGIQLPQGTGLSMAAVQAALGYVPAFLQAKATLGWRMRALLRRDFIEEFAADDPAAHFLAPHELPRLRTWSRVNISSYLWAKSALANYILRTLGDGTEMAHGVEGRLPFLDHHLADWASGLALEHKIRGITEKSLLRTTFADLVPEAVRARRKNPFTAPPLLATGPTGVAAEWATLPNSPFFDAAAVAAYRRQLATAAPPEQIAADPVLLLILTAQILQRRFGL